MALTWSKDEKYNSYRTQLFVNKEKLRTLIFEMYRLGTRLDFLNTKILNDAGIRFVSQRPQLAFDILGDTARLLTEARIDAGIGSLPQSGDNVILQTYQFQTATPSLSDVIGSLLLIRPNGDHTTFTLVGAPEGSELEIYIRKLAAYGVSLNVSAGFKMSANYGSFVGGNAVELKFAEFIPYLAQTLQPTMTMYHEAQHAELTRSKVWKKKTPYSMMVFAGIASDERSVLFRVPPVRDTEDLQRWIQCSRGVHLAEAHRVL